MQQRSPFPRDSGTYGHAQNRKITSLQDNQQYPNNKIKSTQTNIITFIPMNIYYQLHNMANSIFLFIRLVYFILIAILQCIKEISVTGGKPTVLVPLAFVMFTVLIKDAIQQLNRYKKDRSENTRKVDIYNPGNRQFQSKYWEDIQVGSVIRLYQDAVIPCDALVIKTQVKDKCYVETKSLDGQTNLKVRKGFTNDAKFKNMSQDKKRAIYRQQFQVEYTAPNQFLHQFNGFVTYKEQTIPVTIDNLILRSCILRNVHEVICLCLYTGSQTKVVLNARPFQVKTSKLMTQVNKMVIQIFIWQLVIALAAALLSTLIQNSYPALMAYIPMSKFWILTWSWWLMMTYFVPISLMVTMQMVKMFQGSIIQKDLRGYSSQYECFISANNTSVNQNLGQIKYILSDKTGTLTKNQMSFKKLYFNNKSYGQKMSQQEQKYLQSHSKNNNIIHVSLYDKKLQQQLGKEGFENYLRVLYLCNDIIVEKDKDGKLIYNSGSPDQIALIYFAKLYGRELIEETDTAIKVAQTKGGNQILKFQKMALLQFNSDRKRMSKIVKHADGKYEILTKGADSSVVQILKSSQKIKAQNSDEATDKFSTEGLRTLMLAKKWITQKQFSKWYSQFEKASAKIQGRQQALDKCYTSIEKDLQFVGITAIEDKLQDDVAKTIQILKQSGIQFFILTGDKRQTAINIGRSCGMIGENTIIQKIPDYSKKKEENYYKELAQLKKRKTGDVVYTLDASRPIPPDLPLHQTICYRCTPAQKKNFVSFIKQSAPQLTLAIGDGANDAAMITQADVGIAVKGKQGSQAARVSDFVLGQFKFLSFITLYYGRQWYRKNSQLVAYNFFKNWYHVSSVVVYGAYTYFSGVLIFDIYIYELFNLMFASLPIIAFALFDSKYNARQSLSVNYKQIYTPGMNNQQFNQTVYFLTIGRGFIYGFIGLIMIFFLLEDNVLDFYGRTGYLVQSGSVLYFDIVIIINLRILVMSNGFTPFLLFSVFGSIGLYWVTYYIFISTIDTDMSPSFKQQWQTWNIIFVHLMLIAMLILTQFGYKKYKWYDHESKRDPMPLVVEVLKRSTLMSQQL